MRSVINKIFSGNVDESVHAEFIKYSRGVFENRYLLEGKKQKDKWVVKGSAEFANFFVRRCLEKTKGAVDVKGIIVSTDNIEGDCSFEIADTKKYMGITQFIIDGSVEPAAVLTLMDKRPRAFYALSFTAEGTELKIKAKPPKSGKPGTKSKDDDEGPKADFCSLKTTDKSVIEDLFFDHQNFTEIKINHTLEIQSIELPKVYKTPEEMREKAVRKGVVKRMITVDGKKDVKEAKFSA